jgi:hypothetical protein
MGHWRDYRLGPQDAAALGLMLVVVSSWFSFILWADPLLSMRILVHSGLIPPGVRPPGPCPYRSI